MYLVIRSAINNSQIAADIREIRKIMDTQYPAIDDSGENIPEENIEYNFYY